MKQLVRCVLLAAIVCACFADGDAQSRNRQPANHNACPYSQAQPITPYGSANASLEPLWHARNAIKYATAEVSKGSESERQFTRVHDRHDAEREDPYE